MAGVVSGIFPAKLAVCEPDTRAAILDPQGAWLGLLAFSNGLEVLVGR